MNKKLLAASCFVWMSVASFTLSADPLVVFPPGDFSCTAQVDLSGGAPAAAPATPGKRYAATMKQIEMTQVGPIRRNLTTWSDGKVSQFWFLIDKNIGLYQGPEADPNQVFVSRGLYANITPYLLRFDSESVSWITKKTLLGSEDGGLHYKATIVVDAGPPPTTAIYQAWIAPKTLIPLKFDDGDHVYVLTFAKEIPTAPLIMPPAIQAEYERYLKANTPPVHVQ